MTTLLALAASLALNGLLLGLWLGERGRRKDAQWVAKLDRYKPTASVVHPASAESRAAEVVGPASAPDVVIRERMVRSALEEGMSKTDAEAYADELMIGMASLGIGGI
jgi:pyrroline-5-carboxylate reductase